MATYLMLVGGVVLLVIGAEALVSGAQRMARRFGISPMAIGLTVVAFGTSAPELVVSVRAAIAGSAQIAIGNVVGSNLFNILVILGLASLVTPLMIHHQLVRFDVPVMIVVSVVSWWLVADGMLGKVEGAAFLATIIVYTVTGVRRSRRQYGDVRNARADTNEDMGSPTTDSFLMSAVWVAGGLTALSVGAIWLVQGATSLARILGVSELIIGLTIVAGGTSLPEAATSVVAAFRGERDIAVGNVVGSNIFNLLAVLGAAALIAPGGLVVPATAVRIDFALMVLVSLLCLPVFFTGLAITRWEGTLFLGYYGCYLTYLGLASTNHPAMQLFLKTMWFAIPFTLLAIACHVIIHAVRRHRDTNDHTEAKLAG